MTLIGIGVWVEIRIFGGYVMKNIEQIYRYRDSLLDRQCPKHLNTRELRNAWYESIKKEYELLTRKISQ